MADTSAPNNAVDSLVQVISIRLENLHGDVGDMKSILKDLAAAVTKLAIVEERQDQTSRAMERTLVVIDRLDLRIKALELVAPASTQTSTWVTSLLVACAVAVAALIARKIGL